MAGMMAPGVPMGMLGGMVFAGGPMVMDPGIMMHAPRPFSHRVGDWNCLNASFATHSIKKHSLRPRQVALEALVARIIIERKAVGARPISRLLGAFQNTTPKASKARGIVDCTTIYLYAFAKKLGS